MYRRLALAVVSLAAVILAGCTEAPVEPLPSTPLQSAAPQPTPIDGLPTDHTLSLVNLHIAAGKWAFIATTTGNPVGVRINTVWQGTPGALSDRNYSQSPAGDATLDITAAVPYFLSWSYVVLDGSPDDEPTPILLPTAAGSLFNAQSPFSDHDCPDYTSTLGNGVGFLVTHCVVSMSEDGASPAGLAFPVPDQTQQYWFLDAPKPVPLESTSPEPTDTSTP